MTELIKSVKALGEAITGEKIEGDTLFDAVKDAGEKMTGKELEGKELNDIIAETAEEYHGGGGGGVNYQLICNNREDLVSKSYRIDWSKLPDFIENTFGINPDLTLGEIGDIEGQYATNSFVLQFPLAMEDDRYYDGGNSNYFNFEYTLFFQLNFGSSGVATLRSEGYLHGFLDFNATFPYSTTLREAILQLPTSTSGSSSGIYALLILGAITLTENNE